MSQPATFATVGRYGSRSEAEAIARRYRATGRYSVKVVKHTDEDFYRLLLKSK